VEFNAVDELHRFVNSEGTEIRLPETSGSIQIRASAQAKDGMIVRDSAFFYTHDLAKMEPEADVSKAAQSVGETVMKMAAAPLGDNYTGPILFEGEAAPQLLAEVLGRNLHIARKGVGAPGGANAAAVTELEGRRGVRIMPESFDVMDDPTKPGFFGSEEADDEGVPEKPISIVEKGVLKDFLRTREPVRGYLESNGRARLGGSGPTPTNLIVTAHETSSVSDIKQKMIDLCRQRDLNYGIVVRRMDFPSTAPIDEARRIIAAAGAGHPISIPLHVYRLYTDGHEEMIRGVRLRGLNARSLKDILAAGDDSVTFNYLENGAPFALAGYGSGSAEVSVVSPSLLIDDLELTKIDDELPHLPVVGPPSAR
jgi:predicted Zn-dependent protease